MKEIGPFIIEEAVGVWLPLEKVYVMWWPWWKCYPKGYHGEYSVGTGDRGFQIQYIWVDKELKRSMGY